MSLPTSADLIGLDYAYGGEPFLRIALGGTDTGSLDIAYQGEPFNGNDAAPSGPGVGGNPVTVTILTNT